MLSTSFVPKVGAASCGKAEGDLLAKALKSAKLTSLRDYIKSTDLWETDMRDYSNEGPDHLAPLLGLCCG